MATLSFIVSTTGSDVTIDDLDITLEHPTTNYDLTDGFSETELKRSVDLETAINSGDLTTPVTTLSDYIFDEQVPQNIGDLLDVDDTGRQDGYLLQFSTSTNEWVVKDPTTIPELNRKSWSYSAHIDDEDVDVNQWFFKGADKTRTDRTPWVLPVDATLWAIGACSRRNNKEWKVRVRVNGSTLFDFTKSSGNNCDYQAGLTYNLNAGDEIALQYRKVDEDVEIPSTTVYFVERV